MSFTHLAKEAAHLNILDRIKLKDYCEVVTLFDYLEASSCPRFIKSINYHYISSTLRAATSCS